MRPTRTLVLAVTTTLLGGALIGYGVAGAASKPTPQPPRTPDIARHQLHPDATVGATPRPPTPSEATFVAVPACRIVNTSVSGAGGKIANNHARSYYVYGGTGIKAQGGKAGGCRIPNYATAISAHVTAVGASAKGAFAAYASGTSAGPGTLYYAKGLTMTSGGTLALGNGTGKVLSVRNAGGPANLVIDVNGYFAPPIEGMISPSGAIYSGSNRLLGATNPATGEYVVTVDRDVSYCTPTVTPYNGDNVYASAYDFNTNKVTIFVWYLNTSTHVAVPNDFYVYLSVAC